MSDMGAGESRKRFSHTGLLSSYRALQSTKLNL
jgi:hypothetical protein